MLPGKTAWTLLRLLLIARAALVAENLALRQQLGVLQRNASRPRLHRRDRIFWVWLSRLWGGWRSALVIVQPDTVVHWHRQGFRLYWRWKSRGSADGRPAVAREVRDLIRRMAFANPFWGAPRIHGELLKLGIEISQATVAKYMPRPRKPPSPTWRAFLANHLAHMGSIDFFTVPTASFRVLLVFVVLASGAVASSRTASTSSSLGGRRGRLGAPLLLRRACDEAALLRSPRSPTQGAGAASRIPQASSPALSWFPLARSWVLSLTTVYQGQPVRFLAQRII